VETHRSGIDRNARAARKLIPCDDKDRGSVQSLRAQGVRSFSDECASGIRCTSLKADPLCKEHGRSCHTATAGGYDPHSLIRTKLGGMNEFHAAAKEAPPPRSRCKQLVGPFAADCVSGDHDGGEQELHRRLSLR
jgi:hypothetical protein